MKNYNRDHFDGRLKNASEAKRDKLERFKAAANSPEMLATLEAHSLQRSKRIETYAFV